MRTIQTIPRPPEACEDSLFRTRDITLHFPSSFQFLTTRDKPKKYHHEFLNTKLSFIQDPIRSGFFMQTSDSSGLIWIEDPSTSGFFVETRGCSPAASLPFIPPPAAPTAPTAVEEKAYPFLIQTYKSGLKRKIFKDRSGLYIAYRPNPTDEEEWLRTRTRVLGSLPQNLSSTHIVNLKLSTAYEELKTQIDAQVPQEENRFETIELNGRPGVEKVKLGGVAVVWRLEGEEKGYTLISVSNCKSSLELIVARGWKDMLVAVYENI